MRNGDLTPEDKRMLMRESLKAIPLMLVMYPILILFFAI